MAYGGDSLRGFEIGGLILVQNGQQTQSLKVGFEEME